MALENEKAEKLYVEGEVKRIDKKLSFLDDWCARLEELIKKLMSQSYD